VGKGAVLERGLSKCGFDVLVYVTMNTDVFWDVTSCSLVEIFLCFRGSLPLRKAVCNPRRQ